MCLAGGEPEYFANSSNYHSSTLQALYLILMTTTESSTIIPTLKMKKLMHIKERQLAQDHTACDPFY